MVERCCCGTLVEVESHTVQFSMSVVSKTLSFNLHRAVSFVFIQFMTSSNKLAEKVRVSLKYEEAKRR